MPEDFFDKVADLRPAILLKRRDSVTDVFLLNLRSFYEHFFYRTPPAVAATLQHWY